MITREETYVASEFFGITVTTRYSDFKDGEQPRYTGHKRNYRKAKWSKHDYWAERYEHRPRCWKDQRKTKHQYKPIAMG